MSFVEKLRAAPGLRRVAVAVGSSALLPGLIGVVGGSATARSVPSRGFRWSTWTLPSAGMGRDIRVQFQSG